MKIQFFSVNALEPAEDQALIDDFCARHRIVNIDKTLLQDGQFPYWTVSITYLEPSASLKRSPHPVNKRAQIDYQLFFDKPEDFAIYAKLRTLRKEISDAEKVPAFALFTNAQLAAMVTEKVSTKKQLATLEGIGEAKLAKYGKAFLTVLKAEFPPPAPEHKNETNTDTTA